MIFVGRELGVGSHGQGAVIGDPFGGGVRLGAFHAVNVVIQQLLKGAVLFQLPNGGVELLQKLGVVLGDADGVILFRVSGIQDDQALVFLYKDLGGLVVDDHGVQLILEQGLDGFHALVVAGQLRVAQQAVRNIAVDVLVAGGAQLHADAGVGENLSGILGRCIAGSFSGGFFGGRFRSGRLRDGGLGFSGGTAAGIAGAGSKGNAQGRSQERGQNLFQFHIQTHPLL